MKGLIYRELYLARKAYIIGLCSSLLFIFLGVLIRVSMICGNLADLTGEAFENIDMISYYGFSYLPIALLFISFSGDGGVTISDYRSKWSLFSYTLPVGIKGQAGVKYIIKAMFMLGSLLLGFLNILLFAGLSHRSIDINSIKILLIVMMFTTLISSAVTPLTIKYKSSNAVIIRMVIAVIVVYFSFVLWLARWFGQYMGKIDDDTMIDMLFDMLKKLADNVFKLSPIIMVVAMGIGYICSVRQLEKQKIV